LLDLGCDHFQGYLHQRPLPFDDFKRYLTLAIPLLPEAAGAG
jgi:EAL domain-containing protein (putative c-di-GMP-specific phosphodiesterase class I)